MQHNFILPKTKSSISNGMKNEPLISVIIPVYNCEKTIETAIDSIVNQTYKNIEIIVVDDNSTDNTYKLVEKLTNEKIKLIKSPVDLYRFDKKLNRNINAGYLARNTGFKYARGEYITFQDADDASLLNRIEVQYELLIKHEATHITTDWIQFDEKYIGKKLDVSSYIKNNKMKMLEPKEIYKMSQRSKGFIAKISYTLNKLIPFHLKRKRIINKIFFGSLENYPGITGIPLFRRDVIDKVLFRKLTCRVWPSFMGRGADKDFNFQVAETFKNSYVFFIPLYMWRVKNQNQKYKNYNIDKFILK